jgi:hypothetical protein
MPRQRDWLFFQGTWIDLVFITLVFGACAALVIFLVWLVAGERR